MSMRKWIAVACVAALAVAVSAQDEGADPWEVKTSYDLGYATCSEKVDPLAVTSLVVSIVRVGCGQPHQGSGSHNQI